MFLNSLLVSLDKEVQHRSARQFFDRVPQLLCPEAVDRENGARLIHDEIHRRIALKGGSPLFLNFFASLLGPFSLGDVIVRLKDRHRHALLIALQ